jgi:DNA-binding transcriptional LysR family regulator
MERLRRVSSLWSWLPAFRAVAETQHLPTASAQLHVSASALSRTIRLLEEDVGRRLFLRNGRRIELNEAGQRLLVAVRNAMRMRQEHPELVPVVREHDDREVAALLLRGELDVAFVTRPVVHAQLVKLHLGAAPSGIYCGPGHALHGAHEVGLPQVLAHGFVALAPDDRGLSLEGWPPALERRVSLVVSQLAMGLEVCAAGELLAVLPERVASSALHRDRLQRLPLDVIPATDLFAVHRTTLAAGGRAEAVTRAVAQAIATR